MNSIIPLETSLVRVIENVQVEYNRLLQHHGLHMGSPKVILLCSEISSYTSEIRLDITKKDTNMLVDRLEFFAFKNGKPQVTEDELRSWLVEQISALIKAK